MPQTQPFPAIIFESNRSGRYEIYAMNSAGGGIIQLTDANASGAAGSGSPDWSRDGLRIAFSSRRDADWDLYALIGDTESNLTHTQGEDDKADWSPDGTRIAFSSIRGGERWADIYVMDADGTRVHNLTNNSDDDREPAWSPSGTEIAYRSFRDGNYELYLMDVESGAPRQLTHTDPPTWNAMPAWSPDGRWIAFESTRDGNYEIYVMDNNGANLRNLTNNPANDKEPAWSPDGTRIVFSSERDGNFELYLMNVESGAVTRLTYECARDHNPDWRPGEDLNTDETVVVNALAYTTSDANLRSGAGASFATVGSAAASDCLNVRGRSEDGQWLYVSTQNGITAWVARSLVDLRGDFDAIPVSA